MRRHHVLASTSLLFLLPVLAVACGASPEAAGDACDTDGDPCPSGMTCASGGEDGETICQIEPGGSCNAQAEDDFCLGDGVCIEFDGKAECGIPEGGECDGTVDEPHCAGNLECAELVTGGYACHAPVVASGRVFDAQTDAGIEAAHVMALDDQKTALTDIAVSGPDGKYDLRVPVARNEDGSPVDATFTLRAEAQDYQPFPSGLRTSLPIQTSQAQRRDDAEAGNGWIIELPLTDISLIALPSDQKGLASISGTVLAEEKSAGVLVVAESGESAGISTISDKKGAYTIFNVPAGSYEVNGYAADLALQYVATDVGGEAVTGIDLAVRNEDGGTGSISGSVNIVNAPGGSVTSVVLVVASTFDDTFVRGEVPRGLRTPLSGPPDVSGAFEITGVPPGDYVVLAAFENDLLVRDPDPNIAGTQIVTVAMPAPAMPMSLDDSFKITEALAVISPGADEPEAVSGTPTFRWADDSSEEFYTVVVYDAFGNLTWETEVEGASGDDVEVEYGGDALESGMYYQWRATSWKQAGNAEPGPISTTEDLRGVFYVE
jgi:hypothetical protein